MAELLIGSVQLKRISELLGKIITAPDLLTYKIAIDNAVTDEDTKAITLSALLGFLGDGDMLKSVYDTDNSGTVDNSELINGSLFASRWVAVTNGISRSGMLVSMTNNANTQGTSQNIKIVKQFPVVSLGTKLIIPFISQGSKNSTTIVRIIGHSAKNNSNVPLGFTIDFNLGHLTTISNFAVLNSSGNYASAAVNGMNIEITFTANYTSATSDGLFMTLEYMTNDSTANSIDVDNIVMN